MEVNVLLVFAVCRMTIIRYYYIKYKCLILNRINWHIKHMEFIMKYFVIGLKVFLKSSWLIGKDSDAGRDWGQEEKGTTEDEMDGWHHWLNGCESEWTLGVGDGQGSLACCGSWGCKESDTTERLNWTEIKWTRFHKIHVQLWVINYKQIDLNVHTKTTFSK